MLRGDGLTKQFGNVEAVRDVSLTVEPGTVMGFLGANGAGKSTTMKMLVGYLPPTAGRASICGFDPLTRARDARRRLGYLPESNPLPPDMRAESYLHFVARLLGMPRADRRRRVGFVIDRCGLQPVRRRLIRALSKGNRQRVGLASVLVHAPDVLVLDEPTNGLDPGQMAGVRALIRELAAGDGGDDGGGAAHRPRSVLLSTHLLAEVQRVADAAVVIGAGRVVAAGTMDELRLAADATRTRTGGVTWTIDVTGDASEVQAVQVHAEAVRPIGQGAGGTGPGRWEVRGTGDVAPVVAALVYAGCGIRGVRHEGDGLEGLYAAVVGGDLRDAAQDEPGEAVAA